jgi:hypothetical protein
MYFAYLYQLMYFAYLGFKFQNPTPTKKVIEMCCETMRLKTNEEIVV